MTNESREVLKMVFSGKKIAFSVIAGILITAYNIHAGYYTWWGHYVVGGIISTLGASAIISSIWFANTMMRIGFMISLLLMIVTVEYPEKLDSPGALAALCVIFVVYLCVMRYEGREEAKAEHGR